MNAKPHPTEQQPTPRQWASPPQQAKAAQRRWASARPAGDEYRFLYWE